MRSLSAEDVRRVQEILVEPLAERFQEQLDALAVRIERTIDHRIAAVTAETDEKLKRLRPQPRLRKMGKIAAMLAGGAALADTLRAWIHR